jgi:hypothetical protein
MRKVLLFVGAMALSSPALAQVTQGQYGDVQTVPGGYQLTSDVSASTPYAGIYFSFGPGFMLSDLTTLSANYTLNEGTFGVGSPRFTIFDDTANPANAAYIYFGTPNPDGSFSDAGTGTTGNYADLLSTDIRVECNGFVGCTTVYPGTTFADFVAQAGSTGIGAITIDVEGGYAMPLGRQQLTISDFTVNGYHFGAVPEPATWAMMLVGFGGIGIAMRRRRPAKVAQVA